MINILDSFQHVLNKMKPVIMVSVIIVFLCVLFRCQPFVNGAGMNSLVFAKKVVEQSGEEYDLQRRKMVESQIAARGVRDKKVLEAMATVPRHLFIPEDLRGFSYHDAPFPIGLGQTISQPYIVALMTEMLELDSDDIVLEIGTGSGYQAAVLATIVKKVYTIEIIDELGIQATERLKRLGYHNVDVKLADGSIGLPDKSPFDAIIVTAAAEKIPGALINQLKHGGRLVIPVDNTYRGQDLLIVEKNDEGEIDIKKTIPVRFVPLVKEKEIVE
ncbi:MAG: protein-L-isoaspartate(D-aspartate) O-methyltransferase [Candidatus Scalindua sp.]|nr:protein-L-isoaspartate(D-aspartate) O-methyltransferase [Candidatus Scalindua sp.]